MRTLLLRWVTYLAWAVGVGVPAMAQETAFLYQGQLVDDGKLATGVYDFRFRLFDAPEPGAGNAVGAPVLADGVRVSKGGFSTRLDFGNGVFTGRRLWLELEVKTNGVAAFTEGPLAPRQEVTPAPWAMFARSALRSDTAADADLLGGLGAGEYARSVHDHDGVYAPEFHTHSAEDLVTGVLPSGRLSGTYGQPLRLTNPGNEVVGDFTGVFSGAFTGGFGGTFQGDGRGLTNVLWARLADLPFGFADGVDNDTTYSAGPGLLLNGTVFSLQFGGTGTSAQAARADHDHALEHAALDHAHDGAAITTGTIADGRLSANVARLDGNQTFGGTNVFTGEVTLTNTANLFAGSFAGDGSNLTGVRAGLLAPGTVGTLELADSVVTAGKLSGLGAAPGQVLRFSGGTTVAWSDLLWGQLGAVPAGFADGLDNDTTYSGGPGLVLNGTVFSVSFGGTGTTVQAARSDHDHDSEYAALDHGHDAAAITSGTIEDARLSGNVARLDGNQAFAGTNVFSGEVTLTNAANVVVGTFTGDGSGLSGVRAGALAPGTVGTLELADSVVTAGKLSGLGAAPGQVLRFSGGTTVAWSDLLWGQLGAVPAGFADGLDNDTTYSGGPGLVLNGTVFSVSFGGTGTAEQAARSNHDHDSEYAALDHGHDAAAITSGTIEDARLSGNVARLDGNQAFAGTNVFSGEVTLTNAANVVVGTFTGDGSGLSGVRAGALAPGTVGTLELADTVVTAGKLSGLGAAPGQVLRFSGGTTVAWSDLLWAQLGEVPAGFADGLDNDTTYSEGPGLLLNGTVFSVSFGGTGASVQAARSDHDHDLEYAALDHGHDAAAITSGTIEDARLSGNVARLDGNQTFTGTNGFSGVVTLTNAANVVAGTFTGDGSGLSGVRAGALSPGTVGTLELADAVVTAGKLSGLGAAPGQVLRFSGGTTVAWSDLLWGQLGEVPAGFADGVDHDTTYSQGPGLLLDGTVFSVSFGGTGTSEQAARADHDHELEYAALGHGHDGGEIVSGTISDARLSANVARLDADQTFAGASVFSGAVTITNVANLIAGTFSGDGSGLTAVPGGALAAGSVGSASLAEGAVIAGKIGSGAVGTSEIAESAVTVGKLSGLGASPGQVIRFSGGTTVAWSDLLWDQLEGVPEGFADGVDDNTTYSAGLGLTMDGTAFAVAFGESGSEGTAARSDHDHDGTYAPAMHGHDGSEITSGTLADARLSANVARLDGDQLFSGANAFGGSVVATNEANLFAGAFRGDGSALENLPGVALLPRTVGTAALADGAVTGPKLTEGSVTTDKVADGTLTPGDLDLSQFGTAFWGASGNAGTTPGVHFLGTLDAQPLELHAGGARAFRIQPSPQAPSLVGGHTGNSVESGISGAVIAGGGDAELPNFIVGNSDGSAIGGGTDNAIRDGQYAAISGGNFNRVDTAAGAVVSGGERNSILLGSSHSVIGGGLENQISESAGRATVGGGGSNQILAGAHFSTISGGVNNRIGAGSTDSTIAGGTGHSIGDGSPHGTVGGGSGNTIGANVAVGTLSGGANNRLTGDFAVIPGGSDNVAAGDYSFAAGNRAKANHAGAFVWADSTAADFASVRTNEFAVRAGGGVPPCLGGGGGGGAAIPCFVTTDVRADGQRDDRTLRGGGLHGDFGGGGAGPDGGGN